jgi:hypothetical protein
MSTAGEGSDHARDYRQNSLQHIIIAASTRCSYDDGRTSGTRCRARIFDELTASCISAGEGGLSAYYEELGRSAGFDECSKKGWKRSRSAAAMWRGALGAGRLPDAGHARVPRAHLIEAARK